MLVSVIRQILTVGSRISVIILVIIAPLIHPILGVADAVFGVDRWIVILRLVELQETYQTGYGDRQESEELLERSQTQDQRQEEQQLQLEEFDDEE